MVESKSVVFQMIPHTLFIEWDFWTLFTALFIGVLLFMTLFTRRFTVYNIVHYPLVLFMTLFTSHCELLFTYTELFMYMVLFTYTVLFIRLVFFFKCSFLDLFNLKFYA